MLLRNSLRQLPIVKQLNNAGVLKSFSASKFGRYRGHFSSAEQARSTVPKSRCCSYNCDQLVSVGLESLSTIQTLDYPVIFFLQKLLMKNALHSVTDFGGHIGVKFYAFREVVEFPADLKWQVVDVPAMLREGRRRVPPELTSLVFRENVEETEPCDVLLCSGSLQYADVALDDLIGRLPAPPSHILLNKVPISSRQSGFYTLEHSGAAVLPYQVFTSAELDQTRARHGYALTSSWSIPERDFSVISSHGVEGVKMIGQAWTLQQH